MVKTVDLLPVETGLKTRVTLEELPEEIERFLGRAWHQSTSTERARIPYPKQIWRI